MPAHGERTFLHPVAACDDPRELHGLSVVFRRFLRQIPVKQRVVPVLDLHDRRIDVKRKRIFDLIVQDLSVFVFVCDLDPARHAAHDLVQRHLVDVVAVAVEHHELCNGKLIVDEAAHIVVEHFERSRVCEHERLIHRPCFRQRHQKVLHHPHAVVFHDDTFRAVLPADLLQCRGIDLGRILQRMQVYIRIGETGGIVFLFPFLAYQKQRPLARVETFILQRFLYELCLPGVQESEKQIDRDLLGILLIHQSPNTSRTSSSLIWEPITQSLPVTSAGPLRISVSPGT